MIDLQHLGAIHVKDVHLWAHVGVLEQERRLGQLFVLDFSIWLDLDEAAGNDDLSSTADYSLAILELQKLAFNLNCITIEFFSDQILDCLERLYGASPMQILLCKRHAPIPGFKGRVAIERRRYFSAL